MGGAFAIPKSRVFRLELRQIAFIDTFHEIHALTRISLDFALLLHKLKDFVFIRSLFFLFSLEASPS